MGATFLRWALKSNTRNDFDKEGCHGICKFCQLEMETRGNDQKWVLYQDDRVIVFRDIRPAAPYHILVVTRQHIKNCRTIPFTQESVDLLEHMKSVTQLVLRKLIAEKGDTSVDEGTFRIGFHRSFATSQDHLHMHGFAGEIRGWYKRNISYSPSFFFLSADQLLLNIRKSLK